MRSLPGDEQRSQQSAWRAVSLCSANAIAEVCFHYFYHAYAMWTRTTHFTEASGLPESPLKLAVTSCVPWLGHATSPKPYFLPYRPRWESAEGLHLIGAAYSKH